MASSISLPALLGLGVLLAAAPAEGRAAEGGGEGGIFASRCAVCHTIGGGPSMGPDLQGVTERRSEAWLRSFIPDPQGMVDAGDPDAAALVKGGRASMPSGIVQPAEMDALLAELRAGGKPAAAPAEAPAGPEGRAEVGGRLFRGEEPFANGGLPCGACHGLADGSSLGSLAVDLTDVHGRLGEAGLRGALRTLPFPVMKEAYADAPLTEQERADLLAFFASLDASAPGRPASAGLLWGGGAAVAALLFALLGLGWKRQRRSISDELRSQA